MLLSTLLGIVELALPDPSASLAMVHAMEKKAIAIHLE